MKLRICLFILLIFNINMYSQSIWKKLSNQYEQGINFYLSSNMTDAKKELIFISKPSFDLSEYSFALETSEANNSILKLRSFKNNYWQLVFSKRNDNMDKVASEIDSSSVYVTKGFEDKLKIYFQSVLRDSLISRKFDTYDGTTYQFLNKKYKREVHDFDFAINQNYYQLVKVCESIAADLKKGIFNETKYLDIIDKTLQTKILK